MPARLGPDEDSDASSDRPGGSTKGSASRDGEVGAGVWPWPGRVSNTKEQTIPLVASQTGHHARSGHETHGCGAGDTGDTRQWRLFVGSSAGTTRGCHTWAATGQPGSRRSYPSRAIIEFNSRRLFVIGRVNGSRVGGICLGLIQSTCRSHVRRGPLGTPAPRYPGEAHSFPCRSKSFQTRDSRAGDCTITTAARTSREGLKSSVLPATPTDNEPARQRRG